MSSKLLVQHDGPTDRARHWDQPQGLGWQLWRRAHATALSTKQLRRDIQRVRLFPLMRHSLLADVHQRWGIGQSSAVSRFYADLPFVTGRAPFFYEGASPEQLSSPHQGLRRSVDAHLVSSLTSMSYLPRVLRPSQTMTTEGTAQGSSMAGAALMRRGRDMPNPDPALRLPLNRPSSNSFGSQAGIARDSDDGASSDVGPFVKPDSQQSEQQVVRRSSSVSDFINVKSDIRASQPTVASPEAQHNELVGSLLRHRDAPVLRNLMLQGGVEQNVQYPLLNGKSKLPSSVMRQRSGGTPRSSSPSGIQHVETPMSVASDLSRPAYWSASRFYPVAHGDAAIVRLTPSLGGTDEGSVRRHVGALEQQRTSVQRSPIAPMRAREKEWGIVPSPRLLLTKSEPVARKVTGYREPLTNRVADDLHTSPIMFSRTGQSTISFAQKKALLHRQISLRTQSPRDNEVVAGVLRQALSTSLATAVRPPSGQLPYAGYVTGTVTSQNRASLTVTSAAQDNSRLSRASDYGDIVLRRLSGPGVRAGAETDNFTASIGITSVAQPLSHHEPYLRRYNNRTTAITNPLFLAGRGLRAGERSASQDNFGLSRASDYGDIVLRRFSGPGTRAGVETDNFTASIGITSMAQPLSHHEPYLRRYDNRTTAITNPLFLAGHGFRAGERGVSVPPGTVSRFVPPTIAPHTVQRYVVNPDKPILGITGTAAGEDPGSGQRAVSSFSGLTGRWSGALVSPPFLRRFHGRPAQGQQASVMMLRDAAPDLLLAHPLRPEGQDGLAARRYINGAIMQTSPQPAAITTGSAATLTSTGNGQGPGMTETQTRPSQAQMDLDELVEKTWQKLMDKLTIEHERRGRMQWL